PGLLDALRNNVSHKNYDAALFEIGRIFNAAAAPKAIGAGPKPSHPSETKETRHLAITLTGQRQPVFWSGAEREARCDIYDLKGLLEEFFEQFGLRGITYSRRSDNTALFLESATIQLGKFQLGEIGQLLPSLNKRYDLRDAV